MLIRDVVTQNDQAEFANDVQLSWYPNDPRNLPLVRGYMFTGKAIDKKVSSVQVLKTIRDSFLWQPGNASNNRLTVIATYGHGKSHLALALANFFGKPFNSPELNAILNNIAHVAPDEEQGFRTYKENRPPHLVIRLRGDQPASLPQQFISALETAIEEHSNTRGTALPFWFEEALRVFSILTPEQRDRAEATLADHNLDLATLVARIRQRDATAYELCMKAARAALQVNPNLGGEIALEKVLEWAAKEFCSGDTPKAGGILILFDEFSLFVQRYSSRLAQADAPLQDLLNGVENAKTKVVFVAFSQHDPNTVAREIYRSGGDKLDSLLKELERLPSAQHLNLHSSLEIVLNAYLKQTPVFDEMHEQIPAPFVKASAATRTFMGRIYNEANGWDTELFDKTVTYGCFPLHPLTTSLFSSVEFKQVINGRSMIGFVLETLKNRQDEDAIIGNKPNWVHPIELVDWFQEMLNEERYREYRYARESAFLGVNPDPVQEAVLKGILLFIVGRLELGRIGANYEQAISHLTGHQPQECTAALEILKNGGYIRFDETKKVYAFWAANSGATKIQSMLEAELRNRTFGLPEHNALNKDGSDWLVPQEISGVTWGSPEDWKARELFVTRQFFTVDYLKRWLPKSGFKKDQSSLSLSRGAIIRLIALSEDDLAFYNDNAANFMKEALGDSPTPPPILITIPYEPQEQFCNNFLRYDQLSTWDNDKRREVSIEAYTQRINDLRKEIKEGLEKLRTSPDLIVPQAYLNDMMAEGAEHNPGKAMSILYHRAYIYAARPYFTQYTSAATNHRKAVLLLCKSLAQDSIPGDYTTISANKVANDLLAKILKTNGSSGWGLVGPTNMVQAPAKQQIRVAWDKMDRAFIAGSQSVSVKKVLLHFLNAPYGYDPHQIALLFCAWYGHNRRNLKLIRSGNSGSTTLAQYVEEANSPAHLIELLCAIDPPNLERTDPDQLEKDLKLLIQRVSEETFTLAEAKSLRTQLLNHAKNSDLDPDLTKKAQKSGEVLGQDIDDASKYHEEEDDINRCLTNTFALSLQKLFGCYDRIQKLPNIGRIVEPTWKTCAQLRQLAKQQMEAFLQKECSRLEKFTSLADYGGYKNQLEVLKRKVEPLGDLTLSRFIETALGNLEQCRIEHDKKERDRDLVAQIKAISETTPVRDIESNLARLQEMQPHSQSTADLIETKRTALQSALKNDTEKLAEFSARCKQVADQNAAETLYNDCLKSTSQYSQSTLEATYETVLKECKGLVEFFTAVKRIAETDLQSPDDVSSLNSRLTCLVENNLSLLSETQRSAEIKVREVIAEKQARKQQQALDWLADCERKIAKGADLVDLENELARVPPFLPDTANERLAQVRHHLKTEIDKDAAEREAQRQDGPIAGQIQGLPVSGTLAQLRKALAILETLAPILPKTKELKAKRRNQIEEAIQGHLTTLQTFATKANKLTDLSQTKNLEQQLQRIHNLFEGSPEIEQWEQLLQMVQRKQKELEEHEAIRAEDALIIKALQGMSTQKGLASLRDYQEKLQQFTPQLVDTQQARDAKAKEISDAINRTVESLNTWQRRIGQATTTQQMKEIERSGMELRVRFADTPEAKQLEDSLQYCEQLRSVLEDKESIARTKPKTPEEFEQSVSKLKELRSAHSTLLSTTQIGAIEAAEANLLQYVSQMAQTADAWLRQSEQELESGANPHELRKKLNAPPAFLPASCQPILEMVRASNQLRIDEDVVGQIVDKFKHITDRDKRKECVSRLQQMMAE